MKKPTSASTSTSARATRQLARAPRPKGTPRHVGKPRPATGTPKAKAIQCADCEHCRTYREIAQGSSGRYLLKVRCAKVHWRKGKDQFEATYHLHTVLRRVVPACADYESISDDDQDRARYLAALAADLPVERIAYNPDGEPFFPREVL